MNGHPPLIPKKTKPKVCIVGFADGHRGHAPFEDDSYEFWAINRLHAVLPGEKFDRWFELHSLTDFYDKSEEDGGPDMNHRQYLADFAGPIYVRQGDMDLAKQWGWDTTEPFPIDRLIQAFETRYFTNTISWLIALAIAMEFEEISMFGVDMAQDILLQAEYSQQRPSCEYFLGVAVGRGIPVFLPDGSDLLVTSHLYGFEDDRLQKKLVARLKELSERKEAHRGEMHKHQQAGTQAAKEIAGLKGAMTQTFNAIGLPHVPPGFSLPEFLASQQDADELNEHQAAGLDAAHQMLERLAELENRSQQADAGATFFQARLSELDGAMQEIQYQIRNLTTPEVRDDGELD